MNRRIQFFDTKIDQLQKLDLTPITDDRGDLTRLFCFAEMQSIAEFNVSQINMVNNPISGTVRGMHFQAWPGTESKIIYCVKGKIIDICVDVRKNSRTFGKKVEVELSSQIALLVPVGVAHGYQTLTPNTTLVYLHSAEYNHALDRGIHWCNEIAPISWPLDITAISKKDMKLPKEAHYEMPQL